MYQEEASRGADPLLIGDTYSYMSCFYSNSGSGEQKPQKGKPTEEIARKLIEKAVNYSIGC